MLTEVLDYIEPLAPVGPFIHLVTLINRQTGDEQLIMVETDHDSFCAVWRETSKVRAELGLTAYEIFDPILISQPF